MTGNAVAVDSSESCETYRVLVCGGRDFLDQKYLMDYLDRFHKYSKISCIIQGEARGADVMAKTWAILRGVPFEGYPAKWENDRSAGPRRNILMLKQGKPDIVIAFQGGAGTAHMIKIAKAAGVETVSTWLERK